MREQIVEQLPPNRQRLLEGWLPLAQEANEHFGWRLAGPELEVLIIAAEPALLTAQSALAALAILWSKHHQTKAQEGQ